MRLLGLSFFIVALGLFAAHRSHQSVQQEEKAQLPPNKVHILSLDDWLLSKNSREPAQMQKWILDASRVQLITTQANRPITSVRNKTNGFTATLFETSDSTTTDFIQLNQGVNELELILKSGEKLERFSIWLETK